MNESRPSKTARYQDCQDRLATGWNTWSVYSLLSHVLLPEGACINLSIKSYASHTLTEALVNYRNTGVMVKPGIRSFDGRYTELGLKWNHVDVRISSATEGDDLLLLIEPSLPVSGRAPLFLAEQGFLWNRPGNTSREADTLVGTSGNGRSLVLHATHPPVEEPHTPLRSNYLAFSLDNVLGLCTGKRRTLTEIANFIAARRTEYATVASHGEMEELHTAIRSCLAWDTIYDPGAKRVISPVSRVWSTGWGGWVLFCWDTYFAAWLAAADGNRDLAYANAIAMTREKTPEGFVPNFSGANGAKSWDRSQPPVGSMTFLHLYRRFGEKWPLADVFPALLEWNRWWPKMRDTNGFLCWGSNLFPEERKIGFRHENSGVHQRFGAALESGLDNSPMYDETPFDPDRSQMQLADVGLHSLYVADCDALAEIASTLDCIAVAGELRERGNRYRQSLRCLWSEEHGIFLNLRLDTGEFSQRLSPTCFYPLLARAATAAQARTMMRRHFHNPDEFSAQWILPSIVRNDPAYADNDYWRGRIWPPMNFLVYLGLCQYDLPDERRILAEKSKNLFLQEWRGHGHVHENYNAETGLGCDVPNSDPFYHWGALLALIPCLEAKVPPNSLNLGSPSVIGQTIYKTDEP
jgi:hypothetical protein